MRRSISFFAATLGLALIALAFPAPLTAESASDHPRDVGLVPPAPLEQVGRQEPEKEGTEEEESGEKTEAPDEDDDPWWKRLQPYGYIKLDAAWDEAVIDPGNFARWVVSPSIVEPHSHFNMTARQTRLGLRIEGGASPTMSVDGVVEVDFYGGGAENKNRLQLRLAYAHIEFPQSGWEIIAGQAADVVSPLVPRTLNYTVAWWVGNIGYRRPQARATKTFDIGEGSALALTGAIGRTIGDDFQAIEPGDSGADSGLPTLELRSGYSWAVGPEPADPDARRDRAALGISGHIGKERLAEDQVEPHPEFETWSLGIDVALPLGPVLLRGEAWTGTNLDDYLGGIGQGINFEEGRTIDATGGWLDLQVPLGARTSLAIGTGMDDPDDELLSAGARARNGAIWLNAIRKFPLSIRAGLEVSQWFTDYVEAENASSFRIQGSLIFDF